ncbi:MAG: 5'-nucleotidase C-terminal domain-containing protein [Treponema sp.]|jgi:5'-nucleotidase/UDP-sugar diphosphatase|nr:5'-nucleotidase C-terminal domain-containing protein [Treponema sp.]
MIKRHLLFVCVILFVFQSVQISAKAASDAGSAARYELVLLHTNDHHGAVLPNDGRGGLAEQAAYIKAVKTANKQVLLVDAGDINTGSALSNMFNAEPDILAFNRMGYDAGVFGNHEFDGSPAKLQRQMELADYPLLSANIKTANGDYLGVPYLVKRYDGFTVGLFGITTLRTLAIANPDKSLVFINEIDAAIVDGHSHSFFAELKKVGDTYIVTANEWGKYVGQAEITISNGKLSGFDWHPIAIGPDPEVTALLEPYIKKANESLKEVVGVAADDFVFGDRLTRKVETALGDMICDSNVWYFRTVYNQHIDFAFHNGGNIRAELPKGPITQERILTILPFENYLYVVSLKGSEVIKLFEFIATIPQGAGGFPQFSKEVRYTVDYTGGASGVLKDLTINGQPFDEDAEYRFVTNDYLLGGGDGYTVLTQAREPFNTSLLLSYVVVEYIKAQVAQDGVITPETDGRIAIIGGVAQ